MLQRDQHNVENIMLNKKSQSQKTIFYCTLYNSIYIKCLEQANL